MTFITGAFVIGVFSLGGGFPNNKTAFFILRAFSGELSPPLFPSANSDIDVSFKASERH